MSEPANKRLPADAGESPPANSQAETNTVPATADSQVPSASQRERQERRRARRLASLQAVDNDAQPGGAVPPATGAKEVVAFVPNRTKAEQTAAAASMQRSQQVRLRGAERPGQKIDRELSPTKSKLDVSPADLLPKGAAFARLPQNARKRSYGTLISFIVCVVLPVAVAAAYFLFYASPQYVAEFKYVVRDSKSAVSGVSAGGVASLLSSAPAENSTESYMVAEYITSADAVSLLQTKLDVKSLYSYPFVDWVARFDATRPIERFIPYWARMVNASFDQITGIGTVQVRAFKAEDAYLIASTLVSLSEELVNKIANKPQQDAIRFAEADLKRAEDRLKAIRKEVTDFRNAEQLIDPQTSVVTSNVLLAQTLRANLSQLQTELSSLSTRQHNSNATTIQALQTRIKATREQLAVIEAQVGKDRDGNNPLSRVVGQFEQLDLERQFAQAMVQSAMQSLEQARSTALAQHVYVTAFVSPMAPQSPTYPKRWLSVAAAAFVFVLAWMITLLITRSIREHLT